MNTFYANTVQRHIQKLYDERDYYRKLIEENPTLPEHQIEGYQLMAEFYEALIVKAGEHIANHK